MIDKLNTLITISIDGLDGCGKTTQIEMLTKYLESKGIPYDVYQVSKELKQECYSYLRTDLIKDKNRTYGSFFLGQIRDYTKYIYEKLLDNPGNRVIIFDRWIYSTFLYHGYDLEIRDAVCKVYNSGDILIPKLQLFLNTVIKTCMDRVKKRENDDLKELGDEETLVRALFLHGSTRNQGYNIRNDIIDINGNRTPEEIHQEILELIQKVNV